MQQHDHIGLAADTTRRVPATISVPASPQRRSLNLTQVRRERLEALVEHLICLLDVWDGDDDREPGQDDDKCSAGDDDLAPLPKRGWHPGDPDDAEQDDDLEASLQLPTTPDSTRPTLDWRWA